MSHARVSTALLVMAFTGTAGCASAQRTPDAAPSPAQGRLIGGVYRSDAGSREYRLYLPATSAREPRPLLVLLHGCTQSADDIARGAALHEIADSTGMLVLYPEQPAAANPLRCWNWFDAAHQRRGAGEPALLSAMVREIASAQGADPRRVYVAGVSAGGAMALILAASYPELFAAAGSHSGVPLAAATPATALQVMRGGGVGDPAAVAAARTDTRDPSSGDRSRLVPIIVFHGVDDAVVHVENGRATAAQWRGAAGLAGLANAETSTTGEAGGLTFRRSIAGPPDAPLVELWLIDGLGHAWSGGSPAGTYTDPRGPVASDELVRFLLQHRIPEDSR